MFPFRCFRCTSLSKSSARDFLRRIGTSELYVANELCELLLVLFNPLPCGVLGAVVRGEGAIERPGEGASCCV